MLIYCEELGHGWWQGIQSELLSIINLESFRTMWSYNHTLSDYQPARKLNRSHVTDVRQIVKREKKMSVSLFIPEETKRLLLPGARLN